MTESPILESKAQIFKVVSPSDFELGPARAIGALPADATPYCIDFDRQQLLCVAGPDLLEHAFLYQAQRERGRTVIAIPLDELPQSDVAPAFIFSPGRCGSTLLLRAIEAVGLPSASEPDYSRQIGLAFVKKAQSKEACQQMLRAATGVLARALGTATPIVKLKQECNGWPLLLTTAFASCKVVFIVRDRHEWAMSYKRIAPEFTARMAVILLKRAILALDRLCERYDVFICDYRDFSRPDAAYFARLAAFLGHDGAITVQELEQVMARDVQEGTPMASSARGERWVDRAYLGEFDALWTAERPAAIIERRRLAASL